MLAYPDVHGSGPSYLQNYFQPISYTLPLPVDLPVSLYDWGPAAAKQNPDCLLSWLHNGGTGSPLTSGQQKLYISTLLICSDGASAIKIHTLSLPLFLNAALEAHLMKFDVLAQFSQFFGCIFIVERTQCYSLWVKM